MARDHDIGRRWGRSDRGLWHTARVATTSTNGNTFIAWSCGGRSVNSELVSERGEGPVCTGCLRILWEDAPPITPEAPCRAASVDFGLAHDTPTQS